MAAGSHRCIVHLCYALLVLIGGQSAFAQRIDHQLRFDEISTEDGLPHTTVLSSLQDQTGFLWVGTIDGLHRYDGYEFVPFHQTPGNPTGLTNPAARILYEDRWGRLWVGTPAGLFCSNPAKTQFAQYPLACEHRNDQSSLVIHHISSHNEKLWISTSQGLFSLPLMPPRGNDESILPASPPSDCYHANAEGEDLFPSLDVSFHIFDHTNTLWVSIHQYGLYRLDLAEHKTTHLLEIVETHRGAVFDRMLKGAVTEDNTLWACTWDQGIYRISPDRTVVEHVDTLPIVASKAILAEEDGRLWVGSWGKGLFHYDPETDSYSQYQHNPLKEHSLPANVISSINRDRSGNLWVSTIGGGLGKYAPLANQFMHFHHVPSDPSTMPENSVLEIYQDSNKRYWAGTYGGGVIRYDRFDGAFDHIVFDEKDILRNVIQCMAEDEFGTLWCGTESKGLYRIDIETLEPAPVPPDVKYLFGRETSVRDIEVDEAGRLWITAFDLICQVDLFNDDLKTYWLDNDHNVVEYRTTVLEIGSDGDIWVGTETNGLFRLDPDSGETRLYRPDPQDPRSLSDYDIKSMAVDPSGHLWIGTAHGLNRYVAETDDFEIYSLDDGLPNDTIQTIIPLSANELWMSSNHGLFAFNPDAGLLERYEMQDGLQSNIFYSDSGLLDSYGYLHFGGPKGLNVFNPDSLTKNAQPPNVVITGIEVNGAPYKIEAETPRKPLVLPPSNNSILFQFAALDFTNVPQNRYRYRLEGYYPEWSKPTSKNEVLFAHLPAGEYTLHLQGSNNDGLFSETLRLPVIVKPYIWNTWWFQLAGVLVVSLILYYWLRMWAIYAKRHKEILETEVQRRTQELHASNLRLQEEMNKRMETEEQLRQSQKMEAIGRLAGGIAHDFNNLLTVINGYSEMLMMKLRMDAPAYDDAKHIHQAGERAVDLTRQLLSFSRKQVVQVQDLDLNESVKQMQSMLERLVAKDVRLRYEFAPSPLTVRIDPSQMQQIIMNLVVNARDAITGPGEITIATDVTELEQATKQDVLNVPAGAYAVLRVRDNGSGIPPEVVNNLFEPFYTTKEVDQGTGLGLSTVFGITQQHNGGIRVWSEVNQGSTFEILFPLKTQSEPQPQPKPVPEDFEAFAEINHHASRILLVEDEPAICELAETILRDEGFGVIAAHHPRQALQQFEASIDQIDIVITDVSMPEMNGFQLARRLLEKKPELAMIYVSGYMQAQGTEQAPPSRQRLFLNKPFQPKDLLARVREVQEHSKTPTSS